MCDEQAALGTSIIFMQLECTRNLCPPSVWYGRRFVFVERDRGVEPAGRGHAAQAPTVAAAADGGGGVTPFGSFVPTLLVSSYLSFAHLIVRLKTIRKKALERRNKEEKLVKQTAKIDSFLKKNNDEVSSSTRLNDLAEIEAKEITVEGKNKPNDNIKASDLTTPDQVASNSTNIIKKSNPTATVASCSASCNPACDLISTSLPAPLHEDSAMVDKQSELKSSAVESDPALWVVTEDLIDHFSRNGFEQNIEGEDFSKSKRRSEDQYRFLNIKIFKTRLINGEKVCRNYLIYSKSKDSIFCGPCRLFESEHGGQLTSELGFSDWKHAHERLKVHESSLGHKNCLLKMKNRGQVETRVDSQLYIQLEDEKKYWRNVSLRVVVAVKHLATRGLPFRGKTDKFGSTNNGNFLMMLEAISEFDPFLAKHIEHFGNPGKGSTSYLSFATYEKIIEIMVHKVTETIIEQLQKAKYFSFSVDSTPDINHEDQLSLIVRFVQDNAEPVERFLCFLPNTGHKAEDMLQAILKTFDKLNIDIANYRGQSYDNASNMSGQYNGLQAKIKKNANMQHIYLAPHIP
ncbi:unnamed protein product [Diatraea saccharalis]|uniref:TTF-type domain-containing protein n=1 Tax=Diatraea saccharalis TaxID=40085 RepID=A0A9N9R5P4_9NEOP|nr:unnamed protein product [Diatraea saccharalis]